MKSNNIADINANLKLIQFQYEFILIQLIR